MLMPVVTKTFIYSMIQKHKCEKLADGLMTSINNVFILDDDENKNDT